MMEKTLDRAIRLGIIGSCLRSKEYCGRGWEFNLL